GRQKPHGDDSVADNSHVAPEPGSAGSVHDSSTFNKNIETVSRSLNRGHHTDEQQRHKSRCKNQPNASHAPLSLVVDCQIQNAGTPASTIANTNHTSAKSVIKERSQERRG